MVSCLKPSLTSHFSLVFPSMDKFSPLMDQDLVAMSKCGKPGAQPADHLNQECFRILWTEHIYPPTSKPPKFQSTQISTNTQDSPLIWEKLRKDFIHFLSHIHETGSWDAVKRHQNNTQSTKHCTSGDESLLFGFQNTYGNQMCPVVWCLLCKIKSSLSPAGMSCCLNYSREAFLIISLLSGSVGKVTLSNICVHEPHGKICGFDFWNYMDYLGLKWLQGEWSSQSFCFFTSACKQSLLVILMRKIFIFCI